MNRIRDWAYAEEAAYLQALIEEIRADYADPANLYPMMPGVQADLESLEKLLETYIRCNTLPEGELRRPMFDERAALGLGYAISIVVQRWNSRADYPFSHGRRKQNAR